MPLEWSALEISAPLAPPWGGAMPHSMGIILHKLNCDSSHNDEFYLWNQFSFTTCSHMSFAYLQVLLRCFQLLWIRQL
jgi:hypothetical protein